MSSGLAHPVIDYFLQITQIPRPSGDEEQIRQRLIDRAKQRNFDTQVDQAGNLVVSVPATDNLQDRPTIILQSHMDMVTVAAEGSSHDFSTDPIRTCIEEDRITADGTTLGADNGIGIAMMLASIDHPHPPLELLFTIDEERGLTGARHVDPSLLSGHYLINLDSEELGELCISSAGGARIDVGLPVQASEATGEYYQITLSGLLGGHSGVDIHLPRGNAIRLLADMLVGYPGELDLCSFYGGMADNAIPASAKAQLIVDHPQRLQDRLQGYIDQRLIDHHAPDLQIVLDPIDPASRQIVANRKVLLKTLQSLPGGVITHSPDIPGLVQTSCNLGIVSIDAQQGHLTHAPRSSDTDQLDQLITQITNSYVLIDATVATSSRYPGRQEHPDAQFVRHCQERLSEHLGHPAQIVAYHAGLECGALVARLSPPVTAVSFGPTIEHPHSIHERCHLPSVETTFAALVKILATRHSAI